MTDELKMEREAFSEERQQETMNIIEHGLTLTRDPRYAQIVGLALNHDDLLIIKAWQASAKLDRAHTTGGDGDE